MFLSSRQFQLVSSSDTSLRVLYRELRQASFMF